MIFINKILHTLPFLFCIYLNMKPLLRTIIRKIIFEEYNHIIIDSYEYLEFEDIIIEQLYSNSFLEENFNTDVVKRVLVENLNKMKKK